jgi:hypothetical protein
MAGRSAVARWCRGPQIAATPILIELATCPIRPQNLDDQAEGLAKRVPGTVWMAVVPCLVSLVTQLLGAQLQGLCCVVRSQAMLRRESGPRVGQMAGLSSSNAVANPNTGAVSKASS